MSDFDDIDLSHAGPRIAARAQHAVRREAAALLRLALPMAATQLAQMAILATDTLMLGRLSKEALAAAALGNTVFFFAWLMGCGPANAVSCHRPCAGRRRQGRRRSARRGAHGLLDGGDDGAAAAGGAAGDTADPAVLRPATGAGRQCRALYEPAVLGACRLRSSSRCCAASPPRWAIPWRRWR